MTDSTHAQGGRMWALFGALWLIAVLSGMVIVAQYDNTPGVAAAASAGWPDGSRLVRDPGTPTLVMLAHPRCTCTRASLAELAEIMARAEHRPRAYVVFIKPTGVGESWEMTDLWQRAGRIPGVTLVRDDRGVEAEAFGAVTSGQIFLYNDAGRLLFSGGATGSRGHAGDNAGRASVLAFLNDDATVRAGTPVFGCSLFASGDRPDTEGVTSHDLHRN